MHSRRLPTDLHILGLVVLYMGACTYEPPTVAPTGSGGSAGGQIVTTGGAGGAGGAQPCPGPQIRCNGMCTDTSTNPMHCGDCATVCENGFTCAAGMCQPFSMCTPGEMVGCYSGPAGTENTGPCKSGNKTCAADGLSWGPCDGEVLPSTEVCGNIVDEDCNGSALTGSVCLKGMNLVVRYFLDEAVDGQGMMAMDSASIPLNLPVTYDSTNSQPSYISEGTGRGLEWKVADQNGVASMPADGTKVRKLLEGNTKGTIELVTRVDAATINYNRLFTITTNSNNVFALGVYSTPIYSARLNSIDIGSWPADFGKLGRAVYHLVLDTTDTNLSNRVRLYINGQVQTASGGTPPAQNAAFAFINTDSICLGNRDTQLRSLDGTLYYAALYADALSEADIANNTAVLSAWDDK